MNVFLKITEHLLKSFDVIHFVFPEMLDKVAFERITLITAVTGNRYISHYNSNECARQVCGDAGVCLQT